MDAGFGTDVVGLTPENDRRGVGLKVRKKEKERKKKLNVSYTCCGFLSSLFGWLLQSGQECS
jgi:hypothetical protein